MLTADKTRFGMSDTHRKQFLHDALGLVTVPFFGIFVLRMLRLAFQKKWNTISGTHNFRVSTDKRGLGSHAVWHKIADTGKTFETNWALATEHW